MIDRTTSSRDDALRPIFRIVDAAVDRRAETSVSLRRFCIMGPLSAPILLLIVAIAGGLVWAITSV